MARRPFQHPDDTFGFRNDTLWSYSRDPVSGRQLHLRRDPPPEYHLRCFVMARSAKQFFAHARFNPDAPRADAATYAQRVREVVARSPRNQSSAGDRVEFPGYANLREFSRDHAPVCRAHLGGAWQSYMQRGHWRMIMPYTRRGQLREARKLVESVRAHRAPVVHVFTFPALTINHSVLAYDVEETPDRWRFQTYDPNSPDEVLTLDFDRRRRQFSMPPTVYFLGGDINAYEVYCGFFL